mgnify:CR=1 FL=1
MIKILAAIICIQFVMTANADDNRKLYAVGEAYHSVTKKLLYIEKHFSNISTGELQEVLYTDIEQRQIAAKELVIIPGAYGPGFVQFDNRTGQLVSVKPTRMAGTIEVVYRKSLKANEVRNTIESTSNMVIDSGFNTYIIDHWDSLQAGTELLVEFLVPARMSSIKMTVKATDCEEDVARCFSVVPDNFLVKLFAGEIELKYSADNQRLLMFRGLSNISNYSGGGQKVEIHYKYSSKFKFDQKKII